MIDEEPPKSSRTGLANETTKMMLPGAKLVQVPHRLDLVLAWLDPAPSRRGERL